MKSAPADFRKILPMNLVVRCSSIVKKSYHFTTDDKSDRIDEWEVVTFTQDRKYDENYVRLTSDTELHSRTAEDNNSHVYNEFAVNLRGAEMGKHEIGRHYLIGIHRVPDDR